MKIVAWLAAVSLTVPGCTGAAAGPPRRETIRYDTSACFGFCPDYTVTVSSDGRGVFEGHGHTAVRGTRAFTVTAAQFAAFRSRLAPARPAAETLIVPGKPLCGPPATDQITIDVRWREAGTPDRHLALYFGCAMDRYARLRAMLNAAPIELPIAALIGPLGTTR